ncbi:MAG: AIPR family protein [Candidatus Paceibacterota bacterium]
MNEHILKSLEARNLAQAGRIVSYFKSIYPSCDGRQYSQIITCLNAIYGKDHSDDVLKEMITDGDGDGGLIDAIAFRKDSVDIFDFKESANLKLREIQQLSERLSNLVLKKPDSATLNSTDCVRIKKHLQEIHSPKNKREKYNIYIVRKSFALFTVAIKNEVEKIKRNPGVEVHFLDDDKIIGSLLQQDLLESWIISKSKIGILSEGNASLTRGYDFLILTISLADLLKLHKKHLDEGKDLFGQNIRLPKKVEKFSNGISKTVKENAGNFFLFHNGITITANGISANATCFMVSEPQVVNGAQTLGNLYEKYTNNLSDPQLKKAKVLCKIIRADQDLTDLICETSNTQKKVKVEDLRTNDSFQKKLEIYIQSESKGKYSYERKGGKTEGKVVGIQYVRFFQWAYSAFFLDPANAKNAKQRLFEEGDRGEYAKIKKEITKNLSKIIFLCDVGVFVEGQVKKEKKKEKKGFLKNVDLHIIAGLFLLKSVEVKDFEKIYKLLRQFADKKIKNDKSLNNNKLFTKSPEAWKYLKKKLGK